MDLGLPDADHTYSGISAESKIFLIIIWA